MNQKEKLKEVLNDYKKQIELLEEKSFEIRLELQDIKIKEQKDCTHNFKLSSVTKRFSIYRCDKCSKTKAEEKRLE